MLTKTLAVLAFLMGVVTVGGCANDDGDNSGGTAGADLTAPSGAGAKCHTKSGMKDCSSQANRAKAISREVSAMRDLLTSGNHDFARGKASQSADPIELVKMFIKHNNADDPDALKGYKFSTTLKDF